MSSIQKMSIQGIRSFGPEDKDRGVIEFFAPLTLILGPNGTGKTTIIECLKYMTTGSLPAGGKNAATFIHDPKVANEREIKAQIQLQFRNVCGQQYCIKRSMLATQQVKAVKMATLDSVLSWMTPDGRKESITSRCTELDREMVSLLGVSKAVLENVIFCHQEDSAWPLGEAKHVKQKFDDIFASTRYVKAVNNMRDVRKSLDSKAKFAITEVKYLKQNKEKAEEFRADMEETKVKYDSAKETVSTVKERLQPIQEKLDHLTNKENEIYRLNTAIEKLKSERSQMVKGMQELRDSIENEFTGSTAELEEQLEDFHNRVKERERVLKDLEHEQTLLETQLNKLSEEKSTLLMELGKLELEAQNHKDGISGRDWLVKEIAGEYNIEGFSGRLDDARVASFMQDLENTAKDFLQRAREKREEFEEKEGKLQSDIEKAHQTWTTLNTEISLKEETITKNKTEMREINQRLSRVDASKDRLVDVNRELKTTSRELEETEQVVDLDALLREIDELASQRTTLDAKFKRLDAELSRMHSESSARTQLEMLKRDRASREEQIQKLKTRNEDSLKHLLGDMPSEKFTRELNNYISAQTRETQKDTRELQRHQMELSSKRQEHTSLHEQLNNKKEELAGYERRIRNECETQDFDEGLEKLGQDLEKKRNDKGLLEGMTHVYNKYISKLSRENPPCPLCERPFSDNTEVDDLITLLEQRLQIVPDRVQAVDNEIQDCQDRYNRLQQLRPYRASIADLKETDIPNLEARVKNVDEHIVRLRKVVEEKEEELLLKQSDEGTASSLQPDMVLLDKSISEVRELNRKIATQSAKITSGDSDRTIQQVGAEREDVQEKLEEVRNGHERKQKKAMDHQNRVQQLKAASNDLQAEKLTIERDLQDQKQLEQSKAELLATSETLSGEVQVAKDQLKPLRERITRLTGERNRIVAKKEATYDKDKDQFDKMRAAGKDVRAHQKAIDRYVEGGRAEALADRTNQQRQLEKKASDIDITRGKLNTKIQKIRKDLDTQRMQEREMQDNLLLLRRQEEINEKGRTIEREEEKLGGLDVSHLEREKQKLRGQQEHLLKEKHQSEGREQTLKDEIRRFMKELQSEQFCKAEEEYMDKMITLRTTEIARSDLDKAVLAYEHGIMNFHNQKMSEINMIIRELWRNTYRGNDIETIEIQSDEDAIYSGTVKRRNYSYRVVMIKRDIALDMRGRCSAGQKVLASLIIRLALAETFCISCGILALDEPTTNLDRENIESLAYALVEIIKNRSQQKNFQLVVITHDEDFVDLLGRSDYVDKFFKVRKNKYACSELAKADVKDLGSR